MITKRFWIFKEVLNIVGTTDSDDDISDIEGISDDQNGVAGTLGTITDRQEFFGNS